MMLGLILLLFLGLRIIPYLIYQLPPGYDAGLYVAAIKKLGVSADLTFWLLIGAELILFICLYTGVNKLVNKKTALLAVLMLTVSAIHYRSYWYFYLSNIFGLALMLISLVGSEKKNLPLALIGYGLTGILHLPSFLCLTVIYLLHGLMNKKDRMFCFKLLAAVLGLSLVYHLPRFNLIITPYMLPILKSLNPLTASDSPGSFYSLPISFLLSLWLWPAAVYGLINTKTGKLGFFKSGLTAMTGLVLIRSLFYQRLMIMLDLMVVFWAGVGLSQIMAKYPKYKDWWQFYLGILTVFIIGFVVKTAQPLISKQLFDEIRQFKTEAEALVVSTGKDDAAWLIGYTDQPVMAWRFGKEDKYWADAQWAKILGPASLEEKNQLLALLPQPVYLFINDENLYRWPELQQPPCFEPISLHFFKFICSI